MHSLSAFSSILSLLQPVVLLLQSCPLVGVLTKQCPSPPPRPQRSLLSCTYSSMRYAQSSECFGLSTCTTHHGHRPKKAGGRPRSDASIARGHAPDGDHDDADEDESRNHHSSDASRPWRLRTTCHGAEKKRRA